MNKSLLNTYVCPADKTSLTFRSENHRDQGEISEGFLVSAANTKYTLKNSIPNFIAPGQLSKLELETKQQYEEYYTEEFYDNAIEWLFASFCEDENSIRESLVDILQLKPDFKVLEIGCGTGRDSLKIAKRLGRNGVFFIQDLSQSMVDITRNKLTKDYDKLGLSCTLNFFVSSARNLPFPDKYFDAVFHFGGFNNFEDPKGTLHEFSRVVKNGGRIVFGDESIPPWLEGTTFAEIVCTNNPLFRHKVPLSHLPENAKEVTVRWLLGNCFYVIDYRIGNGTPLLNLDLPHKGNRGGTMRTRYYGQMEGITPEAKTLAQKSAKKKGVSLHDWLDQAVRNAARQDLA